MVNGSFSRFRAGATNRSSITSFCTSYRSGMTSTGTPCDAACAIAALQVAGRLVAVPDEHQPVHRVLAHRR